MYNLSKRNIKVCWDNGHKHSDPHFLCAQWLLSTLPCWDKKAGCEVGLWEQVLMHWWHWVYWWVSWPVTHLGKLAGGHYSSLDLWYIWEKHSPDGHYSCLLVFTLGRVYGCASAGILDTIELWIGAESLSPCGGWWYHTLVVHVGLAGLCAVFSEHDCSILIACMLAYWIDKSE